MADTSHEYVCSKWIISQFLFIIEQQTWYQIKVIKKVIGYDQETMKLWAPIDQKQYEKFVKI